jgi:hypothetical protein
MEMVFSFFHSGLKGLIVGFSSNRTLNFVGTVSGAVQDATKKTAGGSQQTAGSSSNRGLKGGHITIATFITIEFELISPVCRKIVVIGSKLYHCHKMDLYRICFSLFPVFDGIILTTKGLFVY